MTQQAVEIKLVERRTPGDADSVDYQPFGVKVLKLKVQRSQDTRPALGPIWLHPKGYVRPQAGSSDPALWRAYGTADDDPDLWVGWGAGDERGFCVKTQDRFLINKEPMPLDDDGAYYVYLHLIHRPADPLAHDLHDHCLTVVATGEDGQVHGEKKFRLTVPAQTTNPARACWQTAPEAGASVITWQGASREALQLPLYVSRWWPTRRVAYAPVDDRAAKFLRDLKIRFERQGQNPDAGRLELFLGGTPVAQIGGYLSPSLYDARLCGFDVMRFLDDRHFVVRLWFYWLHLNFSADQLLAFVPPDRRAALRAEAERVSASLNALVPYYRREEVPDLERFDVLIDPDNLKTKYVGTDTHWQEFWAQVQPDEPLKAQIASWQQIRDVVNQSKDVPKKKPPVFDPLENGLCDLINQWSGQRCPHRGQGQLVLAARVKAGREYARCPRCGSHFTGDEVREVGWWDKHAPWLENAKLADKAVSTNVLEG